MRIQSQAVVELDSLGMVTRNGKQRGRGWLVGQAYAGWCSRLGFFHGMMLIVVAKVGLHNFFLWLNRQLGRPPLAFVDLIDW